MTSLYIIVKGLDEMSQQFFKASKTAIPFKSVSRLEGVFEAAYDRTQTEVHVQTGKLKESGTRHTDYDGDVWSGEIAYARNPGIFELARGDAPSAMHPTGGHAAYLSLDAYYEILDADVNRIFDDVFQTKAVGE